MSKTIKAREMVYNYTRLLRSSASLKKAADISLSHSKASYVFFDDAFYGREVKSLIIHDEKEKKTRI